MVGDNGTSTEVPLDREAWEALPRGAQQTVLKLLRLFAEGHTGTISITTYHGGVRRVDVTEMWTPGKEPTHIRP